MVTVNEVIIVEGRYDKNTLRQVVDATVVTTDGFAIFRDKERQEMLRQLAKRRGIIVLTDSDGAGQVIRGFLNGIVDPHYVKNAFIPDVIGKERRKSEPSKEGKLGVEGMTPEIILNALRSAGVLLDDSQTKKYGDLITKADLFSLGLTGGVNSSEKRKMLRQAYALPERMSTNSLLQVLNVLTTKEELTQLLAAIEQESQCDRGEQ